MNFVSRPPIIALIAVAAGLLVAGCATNSRSARIHEKSAAYSILSPAQQHQIKSGSIDFGFTSDMVYMALGRPAAIKPGKPGENTVWVFSNYYPSDSMQRVQYTLRRTGGTGMKGNAATTTGPNAGGFTTASSRTEPTPDLPEMANYTLYVFFRDDKVVDLQLEG